MIAYAAGLFFWGWLGDRSNPKYVIVIGMIGSAITMTLFGALPKWAKLYNVPYFVLTYTLFGFVQACGWPSEIAIMANWFGKANRGFIMGMWASCQPLGNVFGSEFVSLMAPMGYEFAFIYGAILMVAGAVIVMLTIRVKPKESHLVTEESIGTGMSVVVEEENREAIGLFRALLLPGVLAVS
ncbi:unnamed protein product [Cylicostephanus goldi]|uniref:Major facilitator superfamily (MFS) profile domain-containing protein n=1 Tax=Cylicostephanus goldi TaxID=71465 RepID=A0A3P7NET9_CYLGO|nr:unnamed protein product [Cylicostephanus goldi]